MARRPNAKPYAAPRAMLVLSLVLTLSAFGFVRREERAAADQRFLRRVDATQSDIQADVDVAVALLRGAVGLYDASREVERAEFGAYVRSLHLRSTYPSLLGLGYAARVGPATVDDLEARVQGDGEPGFRVWPAPTSADDAAVVYLEPRDRGNRRAIGFTMSQEPARRAAMDRARDAGVGAVSASVDLLQDASSTLGGVLVFFPHYAAPAASVDGRRAALRGFVFAPLRLSEVFTGPRGIPPDLAVRVYDGPDPKFATLAYGYPASVPEEARTSWRMLRVADTAWAIQYIERIPLEPLFTWTAWAVLVGGVALAGLVYRLQEVHIDARVRAERDSAALREGERRYRFLADAMPQVVFTADHAGRLAYTNGRWASASIGDSLRTNLIASLHVEDRRTTLEAWDAALATGTPWTVSFRMWSSDIEDWRWILGCALPQPGPSGVEEWVGTLTDIHGQKEAEAALQREADELERRVAERTDELQRSVRELENFAAVASHDLQEPLRKIVAFGDRLSDELGPNVSPEAADALLRMRRSAQRLQQLISDLLTFARVSRAEVIHTPVDMGAMARAVRDDLLDGRGDGAVVDIDDLPLADGDPGLLQQLVSNLLENALKFHRPGEPARVRVFAEPAGDEVDASRREAWFRLLVSDEGIGFDAKYLDRIFQMFQRLHARDRYEGTGIGLAICRRVVELHGGTITARSTPGRGACFVATLPRSVMGTMDS